MRKDSQIKDRNLAKNKDEEFEPIQEKEEIEDETEPLKA